MIAGLLLAAGGATRFGSQKLVAPLDGAPLVRQAAARLSSATDSLVVVVGYDGDAVRRALTDTPARFVENAEWRDGLSTSLRRGVESLDPDIVAIVVALGDEPHIGTDVIRSVIATWRLTGAPIVAARYRGAQGHPVLFERTVFAELLALGGDVGAKPLFARMPERVTYLDVDSEPLRDVDTRHDLDALAGE